VFLRHPREQRLFVRHEDLLARPEDILREILVRCGSAASPPDVGSLRTGMPFHGNRLIEAKVVGLSRDTASSAREDALTRLIQLPWTVAFSRLRPAVTGVAPHEPSAVERHSPEDSAESTDPAGTLPLAGPS
jgi:hypothetical protein